MARQETNTGVLLATGCIRLNEKPLHLAISHCSLLARLSQDSSALTGLTPALCPLTGLTGDHWKT